MVVELTPDGAEPIVRLARTTEFAIVCLSEAKPDGISTELALVGSDDSPHLDGITASWLIMTKLLIGQEAVPESVQQELADTLLTVQRACGHGDPIMLTSNTPPSSEPVH